MTAIATRSPPSSRAQSGKPDGCIAVLNAGSSSIKFAIYHGEPCESLLFCGQVEQIGISPRLRVMDGERATIAEKQWTNDGFDHRTATAEIIRTARTLLEGKPLKAVRSNRSGYPLTFA